MLLLCKATRTPLTASQNDVRRLSRVSSSNTKEWIRDAKQLHKDIDLSRADARDLVQLAKHGKDAFEHLEDTRHKRLLLKNEVAFNERLVEALKAIRSVRETIDHTGDDVSSGRLLEAVDRLLNLENTTSALDRFQGTFALNLLITDIAQIRKIASNSLNDCWNQLVLVSPEEGKIVLKEKLQGMFWIVFSG